MKLNSAIPRHCKVNIDIIGRGGERHERPHSPLTLPEVLGLSDEGERNRSIWNHQLSDNLLNKGSCNDMDGEIKKAYRTSSGEPKASETRFESGAWNSHPIFKL